MMAKFAKRGPPLTLPAMWRPGATGAGSREERDRLLAEAEIILGGWPFPLDLRARAPSLKWFHQRPAGASNLRMGDLFCNSRKDCTAQRSIGLWAHSTIAPIGHFSWTVKPPSFP